MELVPLMVRIGLKADGSHKFPNFNVLPADVRGSADWSVFVDRDGGGWCYDKFAGHDVDDPAIVGDPLFDSPAGTWLGMLLVPEPFALAAVQKFPEECNIATEIYAEKFYEERATVNQPEVNEDATVLQNIANRVQLGDLSKTDDEYKNAMNPGHPSLGRRKNKMKKWADAKVQRGITIKDAGR